MQDGVSDILGDFHPKPFPLGKATACARTPVLWTDFYRLMANHFTRVEVHRLVLGLVFLGCMELVKGLILTRDMVAMIDGTQLHLFFIFFYFIFFFGDTLNEWIGDEVLDRYPYEVLS